MPEAIRVLHVDDDPAFGEMVATFLERDDPRFEVDTRTRAEDALDRLRDGPDSVDCVVSDYALPGMDGVAFLEAVRAEFPELPFVFFTGRGSEAVASDALAAGATDYLQKAGGTEQYGLLANRIRNCVEAYRDRRDLRRAERYRRELYRITSDTAPVGEKITRLLELGCERLGVENGHVVRIDRRSGRHEVRTAAGSTLVEPDTVTDLEETFCRETITAEDILAVYNAPAEGWGDDPAYERWGIACYIGGRIEVGGDLYGTVCFVDREPRERSFTESERGFVDLVTRWLSHAFERERHERDLRTYKHALNAVPEAVCVLDADLAVTVVNDAMLQLAGYGREELLGTDAARLFDGRPLDAEDGDAEPPGDPRDVEAFDATLRTAQGDAIPCRVRWTGLPDAGESGRSGTVLVIRERGGRR